MIKFSHVMKKFNNLTPLKDVCAEVKSGEIISIIGPSGTGKSTLLRIVNGLEKPTSGKVFVDDIEVNDKNKNLITQKVGMVFQNYNLFNHLTVIENLMIAQVEILKRDKQTAYDKSMALLEKVGLVNKENAYPSELSGGEKQRIAFARALTVDPEVLLLDEPTSALDPNSVSIMENLILQLAKANISILMVTHSMKLAKDVSNRVFYLDEGIIYEEGTSNEIFENPKKPNTQIFINDQNIIEFNINKFFDYASAMTKILEFCSKHNTGTRRANKILYVFEEAKTILFEKYEKIELYIRITLKKESTIITIKYKGEKFDIRETSNDISLKLIEGMSINITYSYNEKDEYKNVVEIMVKN